MRVRTVLAALALATTSALGCATSAAAHNGPGLNAVDDPSDSSILGIPVSLYCGANDVLGNPSSCEE
ncbi:hypothetical protein JK361_33035 [Streptomyces sp. 5-8]|uniref:Chaplin domain-containing protein n=1 Tax=Streptomyces musisoli TaxID=2802280 RepID=A0ABS1PAF4_9ACTN|nr:MULTISPECIES: hypothetical protein [Streptomyces]MBL1109356.1 hypothetical protein [Streptomyces musisoli]MBY8846914.1 hypothetical protein [Streptomyces sp. SP2-10]